MDIPILKKLNNYGKNGLVHPIRGCEVGKLIQGYGKLIDLLPDNDKQAILEPLKKSLKNNSKLDVNANRLTLSHKELKSFIQNDFDLTKFGVIDGSRIGVLLPNGKIKLIIYQ